MYCTLCSVTFTQKMAVIQCMPLPKYQEQNGGGEFDVLEAQDNFGVVLPLEAQRRENR